MKYNNSYAKLDPRLYHKQPPTPLKNPKAGHFNHLVADQIWWDEDTELVNNWVDILAGSIVPESFEPLAMAYAGHQFGHWAGQLGDGRGLLMAQVIDKNNQLTDLHLKGAGLTPYSRMGDGRAVLRSTIREYLCGHAMTSLGIKSSTALGFITSETPVHRETLEQGAALMRVSDTHIRLGHVEWIASFAPELLGGFTKNMIETYYPELVSSKKPVIEFISSVVKRTATLIADWQLIGFAHGVMNTDNLSITGTTIDYGPFGFLERFNPAWINNHSDYSGRYSYQNQPAIGYWNLNVWVMHFMQLSNKKVIGDTKEIINREALDNCLAQYEPTFMRHYQQGICRKIGLSWDNFANNTASNNTNYNVSSTENSNISEEEISLNSEAINNTLTLAFEFLEIVENNKLDYTNSFRALIAVIISDEQSYTHTFQHEIQLLENITSELSGEQLNLWLDWQTKYKSHVNRVISYNENNISIEDIISTLKQSNPAYVLRNSMAQQAITKAENGDFSEVDRLFKLLTNPYEVQDIAQVSDIRPPDLGAEPLIISCSS